SLCTQGLEQSSAGNALQPGRIDGCVDHRISDDPWGVRCDVHQDLKSFDDARDGRVQPFECYVQVARTIVREWDAAFLRLPPQDKAAPYKTILVTSIEVVKRSRIRVGRFAF